MGQQWRRICPTLAPKALTGAGFGRLASKIGYARYRRYFSEWLRSLMIFCYVYAVNTTSTDGIIIMRMRYLFILLIALSCLGPAASAQNEPSPGEAHRRVVRKVDPEYPATAKRMNLGGTVRVIAVVASDGNVKKVETVGGSPLFVEAAETAVAKWKYAPGAETRETVELRFTP